VLVLLLKLVLSIERGIDHNKEHDQPETRGYELTDEMEVGDSKIVGYKGDDEVGRTETKGHTFAIPISFIAALAPCVSTFLAAERTSNRA
jgi:hypothetical protein